MKHKSLVEIYLLFILVRSSKGKVESRKYGIDYQATKKFKYMTLLWKLKTSNKAENNHLKGRLAFLLYFGNEIIFFLNTQFIMRNMGMTVAPPSSASCPTRCLQEYNSQNSESAGPGIMPFGNNGSYSCAWNILSWGKLPISKCLGCFFPIFLSLLSRKNTRRQLTAPAMSLLAQSLTKE